MAAGQAPCGAFAQQHNKGPQCGADSLDQGVANAAMPARREMLDELQNACKAEHQDQHGKAMFRVGDRERSSDDRKCRQPLETGRGMRVRPQFNGREREK